MKSTSLVFLGLGAVMFALAATDEVDARGCRSAGCCYTQSYCAPACPTYTVCYVDQVQTGYRSVTRSKIVPVNITEYVTKAVQEPYTYTVYENVTTPMSRKVTFYTQTWVDQPFTYTVYENVQVPMSRKVTYYTQTWVDQPYTYTVYENVMVPMSRKVTYYTQTWVDQPYTYTECVPVVTPVTYNVTEYTTVAKPIVVQQTVCTGYNTCYVSGCCGCCYPVCTPCYATVNVPSTTYECVAVQRPVTVNVTSYTHVQKQGSQKVCQLVPAVRDEPYQVCQVVAKQMQGSQKVCQLVANVRDEAYSVCQVVAKQMQGSQKVCQLVPGVRDETYYVCNVVAKQMQGTSTRYICEPVVKTISTTQYYCELEPYAYTVRVPVCVPCAPAAPVCYSGYGYCP